MLSITRETMGKNTGRLIDSKRTEIGEMGCTMAKQQCCCGLHLKASKLIN